jgi:hypothetical protein
VVNKVAHGALVNKELGELQAQLLLVVNNKVLGVLEQLVKVV